MEDELQDELQEVQKLIDKILVENDMKLIVQDGFIYVMDDDNKVVELDNLTHISYDKDLYVFVVYFSRTFTIPMQESLKIHDDTFTFGEGLKMVGSILEEQIEKPRRFHISEDDHSFPTPFSVICSRSFTSSFF